MNAQCFGTPDSGPTVDLQPSNFVDPDTVIEGELVQRAHVFHSSPDERFMVGLWQCSRYKERVDGHPCDEITVILEGVVTVTDGDGKSQTFSAGDRFIMQKGWRGTYDVTEPLKKYFIIYAAD